MLRQDPGFLYCPNEFSRAFEKYWDYLASLDQQPDSAKESLYFNPNINPASSRVLVVDFGA
jgi:hypothetical protein